MSPKCSRFVSLSRCAKPASVTRGLEICRSVRCCQPLEMDQVAVGEFDPSEAQTLELRHFPQVHETWAVDLRPGVETQVAELFQTAKWASP